MIRKQYLVTMALLMLIALAAADVPINPEQIDTVKAQAEFVPVPWSPPPRDPYALVKIKQREVDLWHRTVWNQTVWQNEIERQEAEQRERLRRERLAEAARRRARRSDPPVRAAASGPIVSGDVWGALAHCETRNRNLNTGNGFYGYFQFMLRTWQSVGGTGYPHHHSYAEQLHRAQILQARSGWGQWPHCARQLGLI